MTDERLAAIEASHRPGVTVNRIGPDFGKRPCQDCRRAWPCDTAIVLARLREVEQENERLERELRRCEEGHLA
jgi:transposase-like protein